MLKVIKSILYKKLCKYKLLRQIEKGISPPGTLLRDTGKNTNILELKNATHIPTQLIMINDAI